MHLRKLSGGQVGCEEALALPDAFESADLILILSFYEGELFNVSKCVSLCNSKSCLHRNCKKGENFRPDKLRIRMAIPHSANCVLQACSCPTARCLQVDASRAFEQVLRAGRKTST